jgi:PAS domain S-box-containing protein
MTVPKQVPDSVGTSDGQRERTTAIFAVDFEGRVLSWNQAAEHLYGRTAEEMLGKPVSVSHRYEWLGGNNEKAVLKRIHRRGRWSGINFHILPDGRSLFVESEIVLFHDGNGLDIGLMTVILVATESPFELFLLLRKRRLWGTIMVVSGLVALSGNFLPTTGAWDTFPILCIPIAIVAIFKWKRLVAASNREGRRTVARSTIPAAEEVALPKQAPVLYLRSFDDDEAAANLQGELTEEEHLGSVLAQIGPFLAVGRPGEPFPELGASRVYLGDDIWQGTVAELLGVARLVVIRTGRSQGLLWEVERVARTIKPERLVILADNRRELVDVLAQIRKVHPQVNEKLRFASRSIGSIKDILVFDENWQASCLRVRGAGFYAIAFGRDPESWAGARFARTLRPVFRRLGVRQQRPPIDWAKALGAVTIVGLLLWTFAVALGIVPNK